ncbi:hypothetical protein Tco_0809396 [Tanacetum coccineum]
MMQLSLEMLYAFMVWILEAIPATHVYACKQPTEIILRALAWRSLLPFTWTRCCTLLVSDKLAPSLETLTPTKSESDTSDARDFGVMSDGDIPAYMSLGPSYTSPAPTTQKSLSLANQRKLQPRRTPLRFNSSMITYTLKCVRLTKPPPSSTTTAMVATMSVPDK